MSHRKFALLNIMGNECQCCGYKRCTSALEFHHINSAEKRFNFSDTNVGIYELIEELRKCVLVCANCHHEIHAGLLKCPESGFNEERANSILAKK